MRPNTSNKESILAITLLLLILFIYFKEVNFIYAAAFLILLSLLSNGISEWLDRLWKKATHLLGLISSTVILSVIFLFFVFPWGLILKLLNRNPMLLNSSNRSTTFVIRNKLFNKKDLQNPY